MLKLTCNFLAVKTPSNPSYSLLLSGPEQRMNSGMTDEERQRAMDFIVEQQAQLSVNQQKSDERTSRLERILKLMINAGRRTRRQVRELDERFEQRFARLTDFIVEQQAKLSVNQLKGEERTIQLERIVKLMISAGWRTRRQVTETDERFEQRFAKIADAITTLAENQVRTEASNAHTDRRLDALIDVMRESRSGKS
jgi:hypothetical protein